MRLAELSPLCSVLLVNERSIVLQIAVEEVEDGLHPSELAVTIRTAEGNTEEVAVHRGLVNERRPKAYLVGVEGNRVLVELPRETVSGHWRVWMPKASVYSVREAIV